MRMACAQRANNSSEDGEELALTEGFVEEALLRLMDQPRAQQPQPMIRLLQPKFLSQL